MRTFSPSGLCGTSSFLGTSGECSMKAGHLPGHAQNAPRGAVVIDQRLDKSRGPGAIAARDAGKALQENREAAERRAAKAVDRLRVVAHGDDVAMVRRQRQSSSICAMLVSWNSSTRM